MRIQIRNGCRSVLCGVVLASGIASAQLAGPSGPAQASAEAERDALLTANATDAPVWVTLYERGARSGEECFRPGHGKLWVFRQPRGALRVQAQLAPNCVRPASAPAPGSCAAMFDVPPGLQLVELQGNGRKCEWKPSSPPAEKQQKLAAGPRGLFIARNTFEKNPMWVTVYEWGLLGRKIVETGCVEPRQIGSFARPRGRDGGYPLGETHYIRAEVTQGAHCASGKVLCDTTVSAVPSLGKQTLELRTGCWWETVNGR